MTTTLFYRIINAMVNIDLQKKMSHHIWWSTFWSSLSRVSYHNKNARKHIKDNPAIICEFLYKDQKCCIQIKAHMNLQNNLVAWWRHMAT